MTTLCPSPKFKAFNVGSTTPLVGGKLYTYDAGTTTPRVTYKDSTGAVLNTNPVILNSNGEADVWLDGSPYKLVLKDSADASIWSVDNVLSLESAIAALAASVIKTVTTYADISTALASLSIGNEFSLIGHTVAGTGGGIFDVVAAGSLVTNNGTVVVSGAKAAVRRIEGRLKPEMFGAINDGVVDDLAAINAANAAAGGAEFVEFNGNYKVSAILPMPRRTSGDFRIIGSIKWSYLKECVQEGNCYATGDIEIDSVWYSKFNRIECAGKVTLYSSSASWGTFWNDFGQVRCDGTLIFDVDQGQSVNQNNFSACVCRGGIHVKGVSTTSIREAHNNLFLSVDTTGANLTATDGSTGWHILNDSDLNQTNTVMNWYAEVSGIQGMKGNWNLLCDNVDSNSPAFGAGRYNVRLGSRASGRQASYLPMAIHNAAEGGDWGVLDGTGKPPSITLSGSTALTLLSAVSASAENSPEKSRSGVKCDGSISFSNISISYNLTNSNRMCGTAYIYQEGNPALSIEILDGAGATVSNGGGRLTAIGNNWYILRFGSQSGTLDVAAGELFGTIRIFSSLGVALTPADFRVLTSFFITTEATTPLPSVKLGQTVGYSTAAPTAGNWNRGDICWNTTPSAGGIPGWMCTLGGNPGTWRDMAPLA